MNTAPTGDLSRFVHRRSTETRVMKELLTAPTAPLSLAKVKMSSAKDISVAFLSQDTKAIHGVTANNVILNK